VSIVARVSEAKVDTRCFNLPSYMLEQGCYRGIPTHVVVPSVSRAALVHGLAGTIFVEKPSSAGVAKPVGENVRFCAEAIPCTESRIAACMAFSAEALIAGLTVGAAGADCPRDGGEDVPGTTEGPLIPPGGTPPAAAPRAAGMTPETLAEPARPGTGEPPLGPTLKLGLTLPPPAPPAAPVVGATRFTLGELFPAVPPWVEGVICDGLTPTVWPSAAGAVTVLAFTFAGLAEGVICEGLIASVWP
jgi:hypothetical protein